MKKILLIIVTLFISDIAYSQVQRGNNFQRRGTVDRDQVRERLEMRRESVQSGEIDPVRILNLTEEQRKSFKEINSKHLSAVKPIKKEMMKKKLEMQLEKMEDKIDIAALIAMGDIATGEKVFKKCAACHSIVKDGKNNIGPALYNVVGRDVGAISDYKYSKALAGYGKAWTFEELNGYLLKPAKWIKGAKMAFAGLRKEKDRASVILYLNQNSDNPLPLP